MDNGAPPTASVIIINYNGGGILPVIQEGISSIKNQTMSDWELILVDDGSTDGSNEFLSSLADGKEVRFVQGAHRGVGSARNLGLEVARGRYLAFLDNDAIPAKDWLEQVVTFCEAHPECGAGASLVFFADRSGVINSAGSVLNELAHGKGVGSQELYPYCSMPEEVMYATGNGMVIRQEVLDQVGEFDEGFVFYGHDDSDMGIRIRDAGYPIVPISDAILFHLHSTSKQEPGMGFWDQRNRLRFVLKHYSFRELVSFISSDVHQYLTGSSWREYVRAWRSAVRGGRDLLEYRAAQRNQSPYFQRFGRFFSPENHYIIAPDNRMFAKTWHPVEHGVRTGVNEEDYLYQGWYGEMHSSTQEFRWAMPVASLRFSASRPVDKFTLSAILPPSINHQSIKVHLYGWSEKWYLGAPFVSKEIMIDDDRVTESVFHVGHSPWTGKGLMVFDAKEWFQEPGYFPRRIAWGLVSLEAHTCAS